VIALFTLVMIAIVTVFQFLQLFSTWRYWRQVSSLLHIIDTQNESIRLMSVEIHALAERVDRLERRPYMVQGGRT
jgi:hypothetical protein